MSRRECPAVGADLLAAVSACLAVLKTHLASDDPRVSLRAASELTKLLSVCARNGIELGAPAPEVGPARRAGLVELAEPATPEASVESAGGGDDYAVQLNHPPAPTPPPTAPDADRKRKLFRSPTVRIGSRSPAPPSRATVPQPALPPGKPRLTSFLGRADPVSQPQRPARPLALPD